MPDLSLTPARMATRSVKAITVGWAKSIRVALRIGWLRGMTRSQRLRARAPRVALRARRPRVVLRARRPRVVSARTPELAAAVLAGAGAQYLLDPADGKRRRHMVRDRALAAGRRLTRRGAQEVRYAQGQMKGAVHEASSTPSPPADDRALADRVRTEIFRRPDAPKGSVNVSALDGIVYLRGEIGTAEEIDRLVSEAGRVPGVRTVESLLHTPGSPAPMGGAA